MSTDRAPDPASLDLRERRALRLGDGWVGFDDEALYLQRGDDRIRVGFDSVAELSLQGYDTELLVLSLVLVVFGLYFLPQHPGSLLFSLAGVASLARLFRHRNELRLRVEGRAKPLTLHPEAAVSFYDALGEAMDGSVVSERRTLRG